MQADGLPMPRRLWATSAILLGTFLGTLDSSIANVALPTIAEDLHGSPAAAVWVVSGYQLAMAIALLPMATIGERIGAKRLYVFGTLVFALASLGCALAPDLAWLVAARVVQGLGGACTSVVGGVLVRQVFPARLLGHGISLFGLVVAISAALGPTVASAILAVADWPWLFAINIPLAGLAIAAAARFLPETPCQPRPFDAIGAVLNALGISALILGVDWLGSSWGRGIAMMLAGAALLAGLLLHQRRRQHPLVPLDLMRIPLFALSFFTLDLLLRRAIDRLRLAAVRGSRGRGRVRAVGRRRRHRAFVAGRRRVRGVGRRGQHGALGGLIIGLADDRQILNAAPRPGPERAR